MLLTVVAQIISRDLPPEKREQVMDSIAWAAGVLIGKLTTINIDQNTQLIRSLETKALDAGIKAKRARDKNKAEGYRQAAQAYQTAIDELSETIITTDKEFIKVKHYIGKIARVVSSCKDPDRR